MGVWDAISASRTHIPEIEIFARLVLAIAFGAIIGVDRELRDHSAGLRTHMLTALAAALFTVVTLELLHTLDHGDKATSADPLRVIEAVTAGVAFLAAGAIIRSGRQVRGLTTGASMWLAGAVGLSCGGGYYTIAAMATGLTLVILTVLKWFERRALGTAGEAQSSGED